METIITNIKERILKIPENEAISKEKFFSDLGITYGNFKGKAKEKALSSDVLAKIVTRYPTYNVNWLLTGKGQMIAKAYEYGQVSEPITTYNLRTDHSISDQLIPLYNLSATASLSSVFTHTDENTLGMIQIPNLPKCDGAITITGDSMYPLLKSGDMVIYKNVPDPLTAIIFYGEMYLLSFVINEDEFIAVKWIQRSDQKDHIKLVSENTHHDPVEIPRTSIKALALIKASVRVNSMR